MATGHEVEDDGPWWHRPAASVAMLGAVLAVLLGAIVLVGSTVGDTLPEVGLDEAGADRWGGPLAIQEAAEDVYAAVIPECASGPITRIVLWDATSEPYWEVSGPPTPLSEFFVGFPIEGFDTDVEYREPPEDELVRLVVFRRVGPPVGIRYRRSDLSSGNLMGGDPMRSYTKEGWMEAGVCPGATPESDGLEDDGASSDTESDEPADEEAPPESDGEQDPDQDDQPSDTVDDGFFEGPEIDGD